MQRKKKDYKTHKSEYQHQLILNSFKVWNFWICFRMPKDISNKSARGFNFDYRLWHGLSLL